MITREKIGIACNYSKLQYSLLDDHINNHMKDLHSCNDKFMVLFDIAYVLNILERICDLTETSFSDKELSNDDSTILAYGILNSIAHYRHYVSSRLRRSSILVLYSSDGTHYSRYENTFAKLNKILNLFNKTIFIERLDDDIKFAYQHMAYFTSMNISSLNMKINKRCRIIYVGNNPLSSQLLRIDRDMIHIKHNSIKSGLDVFFQSDIIKLPVEKNSIRNIDLLTSMLSIMGFKHGYARLFSAKNKKAVAVYNTIYNNCKFEVNKDDPYTIIEGLNLDVSDKELFVLRLKVLDVDFNNKLFSLSKTMFNVWNSKIHTRAIYNSDSFKSFDDMSLNVQWLIL